MNIKICLLDGRQIHIVRDNQYFEDTVNSLTDSLELAQESENDVFVTRGENDIVLIPASLLKTSFIVVNK